jgi:hypothetical protein
MLLEPMVVEVSMFTNSVYQIVEQEIQDYLQEHLPTKSKMPVYHYKPKSTAQNGTLFGHQISGRVRNPTSGEI